MAHDAVDNHELPDGKPWLPKEPLNLKMIMLPLVIQNQHLHPCVRGLALHLMQNQYCNIGFFFRSLSDSEIEYLKHTFKVAECERVDEAAEQPMPAMQTIILLAFLLGRAEGQTDMQPDYIREAVKNLGSLIFIEDMVRKDKLKVDRMGYSLTDVNRKVVLDKTVKEMQKLYKEQDE